MSAAARPTVSVYQSDDASQVITSLPLPAVFTAPIRPDVVGFVHTNIAKNKRQAYAVARNAGEQTAAESWGTGRAVARIPRVPGGGTHRAGQGAFGNMCRGGRMFAPNRIWRKWHRIVNQNQRRYAVASALAATAVPPLVMARGHRISNIPEVPLVIGGSVNSIQKTKEAYKLLQRVGASDDVDKCKDSKQLRQGSGKMRNRRYTMRRGPLIVYDGPSSSRESTLYKAFRNLPGVELAHVDRLNLLQLAPGGHMGRFVIWTQGAFEKLDSIYGTQDKKSEKKVDYTLPRAIISNPDLSRVINSDEIQSVINPAKSQSRLILRKKNPLKNLGVMVKLNPYALAHRRAEVRNQLAREQKKEKATKVKRERNTRKARSAFVAGMTTD